MRITHSTIEPSYDLMNVKGMILLFLEKYITFYSFVDKYGDASRGYKLSNKDKYINNIVNDGSHCTIITLIGIIKVMVIFHIGQLLVEIFQYLLLVLILKIYC